jgi:hypothetical protein
MKFKNQLGWIPKLKILSEEKGDVLLLLILFLGAFSMSAIIFQKKILLFNEEIKQRKQTYSCFKKTFDHYEKLLIFLDKSNLAIQGINAAILIKPTPELFQLKKVIQKSQGVKAKISFLKVAKGNGCEGLQKLSMLKVFPLPHRGIKIKRSLSGLALRKDNVEKLVLPSKKKIPFLFTLTGKVQYKPRLNVFLLKETTFLKPERI